MLQASGITKKYGSLEVLKGIDLTVSKGEILSIAGSSGAGKTTLLHILGTLDRADQGTLSIDGKRLDALSGKDLAAFRNQHIGFIFQFHHLLPEFSAKENICIPGWICGKATASLEKKALLLMERLGIGHRVDHKPNELSGGEQQRVAVARALINDPGIIFADEPTGNLDSANANSLHKLFQQLRDELDQTFVIVTHNEELAAMSDRVLHMKDGRWA
ncbi:MAG: ABC transporter ATP-binding protein [bacterium]|jgi:lipoprotein-releasing system ATP-binding protein